MVFKKWFLIQVFCLSSVVFSQSIEKEGNVVDSLNYVIDNAKHDTIKVDVLLSFDYIINDLFARINYHKEAIRICENNLLKNISTTEYQFYNRNLASAYNNIGNNYYDIGAYNEAIVFYTKSLKLNDKLNNHEGIGIANSNIGLIYEDLGDYVKAISYYEKSLKTDKLLSNKKGEASALLNIGSSYFELEKYNAAQSNFEECIEISKEIDFTRGVVTGLTNLGVVSNQKEKYDEGIAYLKESIELNNGEFMSSMAFSYLEISDSYLNLNEYKLAESYAEKALKISEDNNYFFESMLASKAVYDIYKIQKKYYLAIQVGEKYTMYKDSVAKDDNLYEVINQENRYQYENQYLADSLAFQKEEEINRLAHQSQLKEKQQEKNILYGGLFALSLLGVLILIGYFRKKKDNTIISLQKEKVERQAIILEEKNKEILDSINYAKRIQTAILPPKKIVEEYFMNSFIYYKPKDIVAGDFYWMEKKGDKVLFAAADCTGHGVPGAMVSVICNNALNRSVREYNLSVPGEILDKTREIVIEEFQKSEEEVKDGMDIALCSLNGNVLEYAGAYNPLWIVRGEEIIEIKANKQPIGKFVKPVPYTTHTFELIKKDTIYIFSDGFIDQFGGEKGKKYRAKSFRELLFSIQDESMDVQKQIINDVFVKWKGDIDQIDDICVIGVRYD